MSSYDHRRYARSDAFRKKDRRWPDRSIKKAPVWASVDLRDGNQALVSPMDLAAKLRLFQLLVRMGFKEIEVGFPAASSTEYRFLRHLVEEGHIPEDVTIQVLTQIREDLIARTFDALRGVRRAIVHIYNSVNPVQREQVFRLDKTGIRKIAEKGARWIRDYASRESGTAWTFEYSPESYSDTEPEFAVEVCSSVREIWKPENGQKVIFNLPATVEMSTPNVFADQVEWFLDYLPGREHVMVSVHTHNDRGSAVAAAELAVMAGVDRVEGTLFGNGERTGNMDILTMAMNLYSSGVDPRLDLSFSREISDVYTECTGLPVSPRHPWFGELVYTAFSGSHQDAIRKGMAFYREKGGLWSVPYLSVDPADLGRRYDEVVRINSQSGKSGLAHVFERDHGILLPSWFLPDFSGLVQEESERTGEEVSSSRLMEIFRIHYLDPAPGWTLRRYAVESTGTLVRLRATVDEHGKRNLEGKGNGIVEALLDALSKHIPQPPDIEQFTEQALSSGTRARAMCFVRVKANDGNSFSAAGEGEDSAEAILQAVLSAVGKGHSPREFS